MEFFSIFGVMLTLELLLFSSTISLYLYFQKLVENQDEDISWSKENTLNFDKKNAIIAKWNLYFKIIFYTMTPQKVMPPFLMCNRTSFLILAGDFWLLLHRMDIRQAFPLGLLIVFQVDGGRTTKARAICTRITTN